MTDKIIIDGKTIGCPCYIDRPLRRYNYGCVIQSQAFSEQQTEEKPILRCDEITNCPIKELYKQLARKTEECEKLKTQLIQRDDIDTFFNTPIEGWSNDQCGVCEYKGEYKQLKSENERLKEELDKLKGTYKPQNYDFIPYEVSQAKKETIKYKQALEEIKTFAKPIKENTCFGMYCGFVDFVLEQCKEALNDRD